MKMMASVSLSAAVATAAMALFPTLGQAQPRHSNPVTTALEATLQRSSRIMSQAAEEMPANKYSFKPTAGSRTFGALVLHIGNSNRITCHWLTGAPAAPRNSLTPTSAKAQLVASLKESFNYCSQALNRFNDSRLSDPVPFFGHRNITAAAEVLALAGDVADHYSQEAAYLRANGMLPPTAHHGRP